MLQKKCKNVLVLFTGKDDLNMCEMTLEATGLTRRANAEILEREFEEEWNKAGGSVYHLQAIRTHQARPTSATAKLTR